MAVTWRNNGDKTENGDYILDVDPENGAAVQTFRGKTRKDVSEQLAQAQFSASRTIQTLKEERRPEPAAPDGKIVPKPLSADERMRLSTEINDPTKFDGVVDRLIEARFGSLATITQRENERIEREESERATAETLKFVNATPDWYPSQKNKIAVFNYVEQNKLAITAANFEIAWDAIKASGQAEMRPTTQPGEEPPAPEPTRPRIANYSTGIREGDTTRTPPVARGKNTYTWADIERMGSKEYERRLREEPGFAAAVDALGPRP